MVAAFNYTVANLLTLLSALTSTVKYILRLFS